MSFYSAREKAGITQAEVAKNFGIKQSAISQWETGRTRPRASLLVKLANFYGCSVDELLKEEDH